VTAAFLAQEGVELAQLARDRAWLANPTSMNTGWTEFSNTTGTYAACFATNGCRLEINDAGNLVTASSCNTSGQDCRLYRRASSGNIPRSLYTFTSSNNTLTPFTRVVRMQNVGSGGQVLVRSQVFWQSGNLRARQSVVVETYLFNAYGI
jgi:hypothetical protein